MSTELLVNAAPRESRAALVENGVLQEVFLERANRRGLISNIYKGRVCRVLPGMQAAFIDVGLDRTAFLHASDIAAPADLEDDMEATRPESVRQLVAEGDEILVQVLKDPLGTKGARLTTYVTIPSRYLVYMPKGRGVGVSSRIEDETERERLREAVKLFVEPGEPGGWIVRTAAEDCGIEALRADMIFLRRLWEVISRRGEGSRAGQLVHEDLPLELRVLRDQLGQHVERVLVDSPAAHARMVEFARTFMPESAGRIELNAAPRPIFDI
jgi:ribonuclease G